MVMAAPRGAPSSPRCAARAADDVPRSASAPRMIVGASLLTSYLLRDGRNVGRKPGQNDRPFDGRDVALLGQRLYPATHCGALARRRRGDRGGDRLADLREVQIEGHFERALTRRRRGTDGAEAHTPLDLERELHELSDDLAVLG